MKHSLASSMPSWKYKRSRHWKPIYTKKNKRELNYLNGQIIKGKRNVKGVQRLTLTHNNGSKKIYDYSTSYMST